MKSQFVFNPLEFSDMDDIWILKYCLNLMSDSSRFVEKLRNLMLEGETGGDIDWGIHRWGEQTATDYEIEEFKGYRAFMGADEHLQGHNEDLEVYLNEDTLKKYLRIVCDWYVTQNPKSKEPIAVLRRQFDI